MLHDRDTIRDELLDDIYATPDLSKPLPKYKFPNNEERAGTSISLFTTN